MKDNSIWTYSFKISSYQVDRKGNLALYALAGMFQEAAREHSRLLKFSYEDMIKYGWIWVLYRLKTRIFRIPRWQENVLLKSWMVKRTRFISRRDFGILSESGERLTAAVSEWALLDINTRKPVLLDKIDSGEAPFIPEMMALKEGPGRISPIENPASLSRYTVKYSDIDVNDHMNNLQYIKMVLDTYPWEWMDTHFVNTLEVHFKSEVKINEELVIKTIFQDRTYTHQVEKERDRTPVALFRIDWKNEV